MTHKKLQANLSIDLDNLWSYLKTARKGNWQDLPSYLPLACPIIAQVYCQTQLTATLFVVGQDLEDRNNRAAIRELASGGHEVANHSFHHEPWLHLYNRQQIEFEVDRTDELLADLNAPHARGFRGPGYSDSPLVHAVLAERGYRFCASQFSSCVGPLARTYYFFKTGLRGKARDGREKLFGSMLSAFGKNRPYQLSTTKMWMVPVTVMPITRLPIHFSYLMFLAERSEQLAFTYFAAALRLCRLFRVSPSLLMHPTDFLGGDEVPELSFFPGMKSPGEVKRTRLIKLLALLKRQFDVVPMSHAVQALVDPTANNGANPRRDLKPQNSPSTLCDPSSPKVPVS